MSDWRYTVACPGRSAYNTHMDLSDWLNYLNLGPDEDGDSSDDAPSDSDVEWEWDQHSLIQAQEVGVPLYLKLRERLCELTIPAWSHHRVIDQMIRTHDTGLIDGGPLCATLVYTKLPGLVAMEIVGIKSVDWLCGDVTDTTDDTVFE